MPKLVKICKKDCLDLGFCIQLDLWLCQLINIPQILKRNEPNICKQSPKPEPKFKMKSRIWETKWKLLKRPSSNSGLNWPNLKIVTVLWMILHFYAKNLLENMWGLKDFSSIQNLREINLDKFRVANFVVLQVL